VGTPAGTVGRAGAVAAIGVVASGLPRVTPPPGVTGRRYVGHWWISRSLSTRSATTCSHTVTDWQWYRQDNQNQTFTSRMRLRSTRDRRKLRVSMDRARFDGTEPAEFFSFLRRLVRACNDSTVWEGEALYWVSSFLTRAATTLFNKILPDTAGHIPGRTVASVPEAVHWLLVN